MKKYYIVREELFGYTFFDKSRLKHKFLFKEELQPFLKERRIDRRKIEFLSIKKKNLRRDIIYSPIRVYFELTLACNLRCRFCFNDSGHARKKELSTKEVFKVLNDLKKHNVMDIRFTGGEVTCRKDWFKILQYAKKLGFAISCNTNAVFLDQKIAKQFAKLDLEQVTVSIDGKKENHEYNRGKGTFDRVVSNLKLMHSLGVRLRINTLVNNRSVKDAAIMLKLASKFVDEINFFTIVFLGRGFHLEQADGVSVQEHYKMSKTINALKNKYSKLRILNFAEVSKTTCVNQDAESKFGLQLGSPSGTTTFNISSDGYYSNGGYSPYISSKLLLGNVKKSSIFDVWQKSKKLDKIRDDNRKLILFCNKCEKFIKKECQGSKYETEIIRLLNPEVKNPTCMFGDGPSLLEIC